MVVCDLSALCPLLSQTSAVMARTPWRGTWRWRSVFWPQSTELWLPTKFTWRELFSSRAWWPAAPRVLSRPRPNKWLIWHCSVTFLSVSPVTDNCLSQLWPGTCPPLSPGYSSCPEVSRRRWRRTTCGPSTNTRGVSPGRGSPPSVTGGPCRTAAGPPGWAAIRTPRWPKRLSCSGSNWMERLCSACCLNKD